MPPPPSAHLDSKCHFGPQKSAILFRTPLKVLQPTVSRESFWIHIIKKWSGKTSPFHLDDNMICFIAFLLFLVQKMVSTKNGYKKTQKN